MASGLEHALLPAEIPEGADVGQTEGKSILTLIAHRS